MQKQQYLQVTSNKNCTANTPLQEEDQAVMLRAERGAKFILISGMELSKPRYFYNLLFFRCSCCII